MANDLTATHADTGLQLIAVTRSFSFNGRKLADPDPRWSVAQVRQFYAGMYPSLTNAEVQDEQGANNEIHYTFVKVHGTKG